mmetsp:Transcript_7346/g.15317  ORF Transcript_7346/g.15317 Transcript_7346/m.15317 type:complete len:229 (+) Transcript_7346:90-776(+)
MYMYKVKVSKKASIACTATEACRYRVVRSTRSCVRLAWLRWPAEAIIDCIASSSPIPFLAVSTMTSAIDLPLPRARSGGSSTSTPALEMSRGAMAPPSSSRSKSRTMSMACRLGFRAGAFRGSGEGRSSVSSLLLRLLKASSEDPGVLKKDPPPVALCDPLLLGVGVPAPSSKYRGLPETSETPWKKLRRRARDELTDNDLADTDSMALFAENDFLVLLSIIGVCTPL